MTRDPNAPLILRITGPRLFLLLAAVAVLVAVGAWGGYRLGRWSGPAPFRAGGHAEQPDAPMEEGGREGEEGFRDAVDLSSGFAVVYRRAGTAEEARRARDDLAARGLPVRIDQDPRRPAAERFRVLVGPFPDRSAAVEAGRGLVPDGSPDVVFLE